MLSSIYSIESYRRKISIHFMLSIDFFFNAPLTHICFLNFRGMYIVALSIFCAMPTTAKYFSFLKILAVTTLLGEQSPNQRSIL